jgi:hypothetical protein
MAKESTRALTGPRVLTQQFENADMVWTVGAGPIPDLWTNRPTTYSESEWLGVDDKAMAYNEQYFDLSGYELDDLTLAPIDVRIQDPGAYLYSGDADAMVMYDIVSNERLSEDDLKLFKTNNDLFVQSGPGMPKGPLDRAQIISGTYRLFTKNANITGIPTLMLNARTVRFGSGNPTNVQKLWVYRIAVFFATPVAGEFLAIPATTVLLMADIYKEDELPYMMRLKRSYELATRD